MGIKSILTLLTLGGLAGAGYYFRDGIKDSFADGKGKVLDLKDTLQTGSKGTTSDNSDLSAISTENSNKPDGTKGNGGKNETQKIIFVPLYNQGQTSLKKEETTTSKSNPEIKKYITNDKKKTSVNNTFSSPYARDNPESYNKQKYGIDYDLLSKASSKQPSRQNIQERKQIEAEKSRQIFDSRSINNW